jgi:hypothetical protein
LNAGFQLAPQFCVVPIDIIFEKDVAVTLRDGVTIHVNLFRPAHAGKLPVLLAWSPYGKGQGSSMSVMGVFGLVGLDNGIVSRGSKNSKARTLPTGAHKAMRSATRTYAASLIRRATAYCGTGRKAATATT